MDMYPEYMVPDIKEGLKMIRTRYLLRDPYEFMRRDNLDDLRRYQEIRYILFVDSKIAEHYIHKYPCDLVTFGKLIRARGYAFAFR